MRADRGDQDSNICSLTQGGKWILATESEEHRQLFNATHSLMTTSMDKHVFIVKEMKMRDRVQILRLHETLKKLYLTSVTSGTTGTVLTSVCGRETENVSNSQTDMKKCLNLMKRSSPPETLSQFTETLRLYVVCRCFLYIFIFICM